MNQTIKNQIMESQMSELAHVSTAQNGQVRSYDWTILATVAILAIALCLLVAIYTDPANIAPADPVATSFYP